LRLGFHGRRRRRSLPYPVWPYICVLYYIYGEDRCVYHIYRTLDPCFMYCNLLYKQKLNLSTSSTHFSFLFFFLIGIDTSWTSRCSSAFDNPFVLISRIQITPGVILPLNLFLKLFRIKHFKLNE
jgi:hypothetical protein